MEDNDKPFECSAPGCGQSFTNEDHLAVHMRKHEMHLALNLGGPIFPGSGKSPSSGLPGLNFVDQTPTPTKFLKNCEEIGLFQELKNPFEEAFKKALDAPESVSDGTSSPFPGPGSNELNTPVPPIPKTVDDVQSLPGKQVNESTKSDLLNLVRKRKESSLISSSSDALSSASSGVKEVKLNKNEKIINLPQASTSLPSTKSPILVTAAQSTTTSPPKTTVSSATMNFPSSTLIQALPLGLQNSTPQLAMQVYLQLSTGQTIPVQIPAAVSPQGLQLVQPNTDKPTLGSTAQQALATGNAPIKVIATESQVAGSLATSVASSTIQPLLTTSITQPVVSTSSQTLSQNSFTKQKLKMALQSQSLPSPKQTIRVIQMPPESKTHISPVLTAENLALLPGASTLTTGLSSLPGTISSGGLTSPNSVDRSYTSDTASSPDPADSTVTIKRLRKDDDLDTDDRRKKFLERNRAAAARCRQKRKHWITNLEKKGDELQSTNNRLQTEVNMLRTEVAQLKTLLLAHKDCPVTIQQRQQGHIPFPGSEVKVASHVVPVENTVTVDDTPTDLSKSSSGHLPEMVAIPFTNLISGNSLLSGATASPSTVVTVPMTTVVNKSIATSSVITSAILGNKKLTIIPKIIKREPRK